MGESRPRPKGPDIRLVKRGLRQKFRGIRQNLDPQDKAAWDQRITANLLRSPRWRRASRVLLFVSKPIEIDTHALISTALRQKKQVLLPRCLDEKGHMAFFAIQSWEDLAPGLYGLLEPDPARCPFWQGESGALCLVPGLAFDEEGFRLGYGKGYYDRFLTSHPVETVGLCFGDLVVPRLPHSPLDRRVSALVTEAGVLAFPQGSAQERMVAHE